MKILSINLFNCQNANLYNFLPTYKGKFFLIKDKTPKETNKMREIHMKRCIFVIKISVTKVYE